MAPDNTVMMSENEEGIEVLITGLEKYTDKKSNRSDETDMGNSTNKLKKRLEKNMVV